MTSVPRGCTITVQVWDEQWGFVVASKTQACGTYVHVVAPTATGVYDWYNTRVTVGGGASVWSPLEYMP